MTDNTDVDFALCDTTCKRIVDRHGNDALATNFSEEERVVALVWSVSGVIENGGFRYLLGTPPTGDPYLEHTIKAFERIGCYEAVKAIKEVLCLFPDCKPPEDKGLRIAQYESHPEETRNAIDSRFWDQLDNITKLLANYIRELKVPGLEGKKHGRA
jgi:hypothetical protein